MPKPKKYTLEEVAHGIADGAILIEIDDTCDIQHSVHFTLASEAIPSDEMAKLATRTCEICDELPASWYVKGVDLPLCDKCKAEYLEEGYDEDVAKNGPLSILPINK